MRKRILNQTDCTKIVVCEDCGQTFCYTKENFGKVPGGKGKLDFICKSCRTKISSQAQIEMHEYHNQMRKRFMKKVEKLCV